MKFWDYRLSSWQAGRNLSHLTFSSCIRTSHSVVSDTLQPHGLYSPWNSPGQNIGVGSLSLLQGIFPTQGSNPGLPHCRQILYQLSHKGKSRILEWVAYPFSIGSSWPRNRTRVSCIAGGFFINWAIRENKKRELPGGPVVKIPSLHWRGHGLKPWPGNFLEARWYRQKNFFLMHKK